MDTPLRWFEMEGGETPGFLYTENYVFSAGAATNRSCDNEVMTIQVEGGCCGLGVPT